MAATPAICCKYLTSFRKVAPVNCEFGRMMNGGDAGRQTQKIPLNECCTSLPWRYSSYLQHNTSGMAGIGMQAPNVMITPHVAGNVEGWHATVAQLIKDQVARWAAGKPLLNVVTDGY